MTTEEGEEYAAIYSDIQTYVSECIPKFVQGEMNLEGDWDSFVDNVRSMDIDRCCEIYQAAVARFNAR